MMPLHMVRIPFNPPQLLRFARDHEVKRDDEDLGYTMHAWFAAMFRTHAPKPFRVMAKQREVLGYSLVPATELLDAARSFATPLAWSALVEGGVASKPMPGSWRSGQRLHLESLTCPVSRKEGEEKDVYLRALDRLGEEAPSRSEVYSDWFVRQIGQAATVERVEVLGVTSRAPMLRRARNGNSRLLTIERPSALLSAEVNVGASELFATLLTRGIGRHRTFGYGMVLLSPPR